MYYLQARCFPLVYRARRMYTIYTHRSNNRQRHTSTRTRPETPQKHKHKTTTTTTTTSKRKGDSLESVNTHLSTSRRGREKEKYHPIQDVKVRDRQGIWPRETSPDIDYQHPGSKLSKVDKSIVTIDGPEHCNDHSNT